MTTAQSQRLILFVSSEAARAESRRVVPQQPSLIADEVMSLLETIGCHLEGRRGGSRFPLLWRMGGALVEDQALAWGPEELDAVVREVGTVEGECQTLPATSAPSFAFNDEGLADVYSRETPSARGSARDRFQDLFDRILAAVAAAQRGGQGLALERRGPLVQWWA